MDTSCEDIIEKLYKNYEILSDAKEKITEVCFFARAYKIYNVLPR